MALNSGLPLSKLPNFNVTNSSSSLLLSAGLVLRSKQMTGPDPGQEYLGIHVIGILQSVIPRSESHRESAIGHYVDFP